MTIAHLGSKTGQQGGPAGYLAQLGRAFDAYGTADHVVALPPLGTSPALAPVQPSGNRAAQQWLRRLRRSVVGPPALYRPSTAEINTPGGKVDEMMSGSWSAMEADVAASVATAVAANTDVLFAHDAAAAETALAQRQPHQQVWLFLHTPMPLALYLTWCWGVPEREWQEVAQLPDVLSWNARELGVIGRVDKVVMPCPESVDELVKGDRRFATALSRVEFLMTGAAAPPRQWPDLSRTELRHRCGLPAAEPVGLYIGNAQPYRGFDRLLDAVRAMPSRADVPGIVAVAGPAIDTLPLIGRVKALGPVRHIADLLAASDFVINVNRFSLFDLSTIEALDLGCPLVLHAVGGNLTFKRLGAGAAMIPDLGARSIADALTGAFQWTTAERAARAAESRHCYGEHVSLRHLRDRHVALYDSAMRVPAQS